MKSDIADIIAELVRQNNPDVDSRIAYQAEALSEIKCTRPLIGRWIDSCDVEYLLSALDLADEDFASRFPASASVKAPERRRMAAAIESHLCECQHCALKRGYELELDGRIEQECIQNRDLLLQILKDERADAAEAGERPDGKAEPLLSANHKI